MEYNLGKIKAIRSYEKKEYPWYDILETGEHWWRFLGIIPIYKVVRTKPLYRNSFSIDIWISKESFIKQCGEEFWKEHFFEGDSIYCKPFLAIWVEGDRLGSYLNASVTKIFETVDELHAYKNNLIRVCESNNVYLKEL